MISTLDKNTNQLIYLISCVLNKEIPSADRLKDVDMNNLYLLAKANSLRAITCMALQSGHLLDGEDADTKKRWNDAKNNAIRKNMLLDSERAGIFSELNKLGIWHMALKGTILQNLYPMYGMREMSDNDILFDASGDNPERVKKLMTAKGYQTARFGKNIDDVYKKPPIFNMEMHRCLFHADHKPDGAASYYADMKKHMIPDEEDTYEYHFSHEEFYIYHVAHAYKHFVLKGTGFRTLVDLYVMDQVWGDDLNWNFVLSTAEQMGFRKFVEQSRSIAKKMFSDPNTELIPDEAEKDYLADTFESDTFRKMKEMQNGDNSIRSSTRLKYVLKRVFIGRADCRIWYPIVYRFPVLLPGLWIYRLVRGVTVKRLALKSELRNIRKA